MAKGTTNRRKTPALAKNLGLPSHYLTGLYYRNDIRVGRNPDGPAAAREVSLLSEPLLLQVV